MWKSGTSVAKWWEETRLSLLSDPSWTAGACSVRFDYFTDNFVPCSIFFPCCWVLFFFVFLFYFIFCSPFLTSLLDKKNIFSMFHLLHLVLAFGRWEWFREPGLVFLYVLPLVYVTRSVQAGFLFVFFRKTKKMRSPSRAETHFLQGEFHCTRQSDWSRQHRTRPLSSW